MSLINLSMPLTGCCDNPLPNSLEQIMTTKSKKTEGKFACFIAEDKERMLLASIMFQAAVTTGQKAYLIMKTAFEDTQTI